MSRVNGSVAGMLASTMRSAAVIGTASSAPTGPHSHPQKNRKRNTTSSDRFSASPSSLGSTMLPVRICAAATHTLTAIGVRPPPNCAKENSDTAAMAASDPTLGMKLSRKVSNPHTTAKRTPKASRISVVAVPTDRLISVLTPMNRRSELSICPRMAGIELSGCENASAKFRVMRCLADRNSSAKKNTSRKDVTPRSTDCAATATLSKDESSRPRNSCRGSKESSTPNLLATNSVAFCRVRSMSGMKSSKSRVNSTRLTTMIRPMPDSTASDRTPVSGTASHNGSLRWSSMTTSTGSIR